MKIDSCKKALTNNAASSYGSYDVLNIRKKYEAKDIG